ncbi:PREDICTED: volume-regulated anion channel subunit LRRC8B [Thamnophis sirtalis]|uniref:Volume-regulated anion channel subunit LRRC8B n=1 Tax=Thamnophis sirtalis TaxID=35019 RepID=A0A6I9XQH2_9SAUR|nr:PREDICTED: volume-regulated anion channel subunit LRRC8B [Thamnophis sirtalis]XP_013918297.1 PREDICTED: volume-regulated anion channel subunit LRRC8B [Thamnophis sirtalis]XP_013918298.1 PREDICTED: volume-regulated anion channel subunit LRRC8B [Thamnophis sirtalis]XP_013918299.1 PREDICTED: volume-regulated anion channel subunit LRRC8B [Thamnophis sirtalis]XP_013918300.1 PREDICTED: volume-regulated anion channel subunit LRRC8B [Thamnophis sirtalis]XP_013918301.1 PREDICTED: volume-regulated an
MITLTELRCLADAQASFHILKPWWDVFCYYLTMIMLLVAVLAGALQLTQTRLLCCLPCKLEFDNHCTVPWHLIKSNINESFNSATPEIHPLQIQNYLHRQQYSYIDAVCYERELHWFAKFFPYLVLLHTFIFAACSNFWLYYPSTSSRLEHFVAILHKCFDSPWTTRALSETVAEQSVRTVPFSKSKTFLPSPSNMTELESKRQSMSYSQTGLETAGRESTSNVLDRREGEQAKSIFEKVKRFRVHVEQKDVIYRVYLKQIVIKVIVFILIMIYVPYYLTFINLEIDCIVDIRTFTGYKRYQCVYSLAEIFKVLASFYVVLVILYGLTCTYSLLWMLRSSLKQYSFEKLREQSNYSDIPDVKNDFAFILHLADQYDPLYSKRFSIFLSEVSENKLKQISLNNEWSLERLKSKLVRNPQEKMELHLFMLSGLPDDVFELTEIEVLTLELIPEVKLPPSLSQLSSLKELNIYHSTLTVEYPALHFLEDNLKILRLKSVDMGKIPRWVFYLKNLQELYLTGCYVPEPQNGFYSEGFQDLVNLKAIHLKNSLSRIPQVVTDQLPSLQKLSIDNEGKKLLVLTNLKKLLNLRILELISCDLERIPHSIFSLNYLREIDLKENNLRTVEEIISFQHLENLSCLKLWHNKISYIPVQIGTLANLEQLYLNHNNIKKIPPQLFLCKKLHYLDLSYNKLTSIPDEIQYLTNLQYFAVTKNHIEALPDELFQCKKLQHLLLGHNSLMYLSPQVGELSNLVHLELKGNYLELLPAELEECNSLKRSCLIVEECLLKTLPLRVTEHIQICLDKV